MLHGIIGKGDAKQISDAIESANQSGVIIAVVALISPGGDVGEGLAIGRLLRQHRLIAVAPSRDDLRLNATECRRSFSVSSHPANLFVDLIPGTEYCTCASACSLAWIGGVARVGTVGLHHHFLSKGTEKFDQFDYILRTWNAKVEDYFDYVRAPTEFELSWFSTPSSELTLLGTEDDNSQYQFDFTYREYLISHCGSFPPAEANSFRHRQARQYSNGKMGAGESYAHELLVEKLESHRKCVEDIVYQIASERQKVIELESD